MLVEESCRLALTCHGGLVFAVRGATKGMAPNTLPEL